jgi:hypothetical protein
MYTLLHYQLLSNVYTITLSHSNVHTITLVYNVYTITLSNQLLSNVCTIKSIIK